MNIVGDAGIIYCLSRKRVEDTAEWLSEKGWHALPYHAGLSNKIRQQKSAAFYSRRRLDHGRNGCVWYGD